MEKRVSPIALSEAPTESLFAMAERRRSRALDAYDGRILMAAGHELKRRGETFGSVPICDETAQTFRLVRDEDAFCESLAEDQIEIAHHRRSSRGDKL